MKKYRNPLIIVSAIICVILIWSLSGDSDQEQEITSKAFIGKFEDVVISSGELIAKNSEDITGPSGLQRYGLYNVKIQNIVAEGSYVNEGDFVCSLDKADVSTKINDLNIELDKAESQFIQTKLDTSLTLREKRNDLENLAFQLKQKNIELEQSEFEPPATIQRIKLDLEKLKGDIIRAHENYDIKRRQSVAKMAEANAELQQKRNRLTKLQDLQKEFTIIAPKNGMVIYKREWDGDKRKAGSTISPWDPAVATLPDLSLMLSKTYINEVDIRKVKVGQIVVLGLDAFPKAKLSGTITNVANVGENRKGNDTKVFEVEIQVNESDSTYRPGMTTSNQIVTDTKDNVLQIPLEALYSEEEVSFVYIKSSVGISKKQVSIGVSNDEFVEILSGLNENDQVYLTEPEAAREKKITLLASAE